MTQRSDIDTLRERNAQLRRDLARAFQEAEQVVLDLANEATRGDLGEGTRRDYTEVRLDLQQAMMIRDKFLATWQELSKEEYST